MKVLVSRGFGAGWSTWNSDIPGLATDAKLVSLVEQGELGKALIYAEDKWPEAYHGGVRDLCVQEVPAGALWRIDEYDGSESLEIFNPDYWSVAE